MRELFPNDLRPSSEGGNARSSLQAVASRGSHYCNGLYSGAATGMSYKIRHTTLVDCSDIALVYGNYYNEGIDGVNPITVKVSLLVNNVYHPVYFNGRRQTIIDAGASMESDTVGITLKKGDLFYSIVYVSVETSGMKFPLGLVAYSDRGEGSATTDITESGTTTANGAYAYHPCAVIGRPLKPTPSVLLVGDSIIQGANDGLQDVGYATRALDAAGIPWIRVAKGGGSTKDFIGKAARTRLSMAKYCTHAIVGYGVNDLNTLTASAIQTNLQSIWNTLVGFNLKVFQCTITPHTSSTDAWISDAQTPSPSEAQVGSTGQRTILNDYIRTLPSPLIGYFDVADLVETSRNSGKWKFPNITNDGLHPTTNGHTVIAAGFDIKKITL